MQTLTFNSTEKVVTLFEGDFENSNVLYSFKNVPTVKPKEEGYYEVIQKITNSDGMEQNIPVARFPISNTNMIIIK
jgi:hypothetical protein